MIFQSLVRETIETEILSRFHLSHISSEIFCFLKVAHYFLLLKFALYLVSQIDILLLFDSKIYIVLTILICCISF